MDTWSRLTVDMCLPLEGVSSRAYARDIILFYLGVFARLFWFFKFAETNIWV
jgi:hypothetical protein